MPSALFLTPRTRSTKEWCAEGLRRLFSIALPKPLPASLSFCVLPCNLFYLFPLFFFHLYAPFFFLLPVQATLQSCLLFPE